MKISRGISNFLEKISSLSHCIVFPLFLCTDHWGRRSYLSVLFFGTLHSNGYMFPFLLAFCFSSFLFTAICKASSDSHFAFLHFFFLGMVFIPVSYTMSWPSIHSSSGTLSLRSNPLKLFVTPTVRDLIQVIPEWSSGFLYFLQFKSQFGYKEFMIWATVSSRSCFCRLYRTSLL